MNHQFKNNYLSIKILSFAVVTPRTKVQSSEIDTLLELPLGTTQSKTGISSRFHFNSGTESVVSLGATAIQKTLDRSELTIADVDLIIAAGATPHQLIPTNSVLIHKAIKAPKSVMCIDLDCTCLSFLSALQIASALLSVGAKKRILIVNSELGSSGINRSHPESLGLFGDAATCFLLEKGDEESPKLLDLKFETHSEFSDLCMLEGGGSMLPSFHQTEMNRDRYYFEMQGAKLFKTALAQLPRFLDSFLQDNRIDMQSINVVVPHQASASAVELIRQKLNIAPERLVTLIENYGNCISASIPMGLAACLGESLAGSFSKIQRGDKVLVLGTGAGLTLGAALLQF